MVKITVDNEVSFGGLYLQMTDPVNESFFLDGIESPNNDNTIISKNLIYRCHF